MGEVRRAHDPRLGRDVALKTALDGDQDSAARLVREARLTARLSHPNIIPVFAADHDEEGRPRYAMRLLAGRTLGEALRAAGSVDARLRYVRTLLQAADAVAYANEQGVLHLDLSSGNVIVGGHGETVVADWGLACTLEEAAEGVGPGGGTRGTRSPEQVRGGTLDARADVYGLGALLYEILVGASPRDPADGPVIPVRGAHPEAPTELAAIAERALEPDPADRYPSAAAFAEDLEAWFAGRRVSAHEYTVWESATRLYRAWRAPLLTAAAGLLLVLGVLVGGLARTARERDRALRAESAAVSARGESEAALARALVAQALSAADEELELQAEVLAAEALGFGESPEARGVLAAFGGPVSARSLGRVAGPTCTERAVDAATARLACRGPDGVALYALDAPETPIAQLHAHVSQVFFAEDGSLALVQDGGELQRWSPPEPPGPPGERPIGTGPRANGSFVDGWIAYTGGGAVGRVHLDGPSEHGRGWCRGYGAPRQAAIAPDGEIVAACELGAVVRGPVDAPRLLTAGDPADGAPTTLAVEPLTGHIHLGTARGRVRVLDGEDGTPLARLEVGGGAVDRLVPAPDRVLVIAGGRGTAHHLPDGATLLSLGVVRPGAAWLDGGERLVLADTSIETWSVEERPPVRRFSTGAGVAGIDVSRTSLAVANGSGAIIVYDRSDGSERARLAWQGSVAKDVAFNGVGTLLLAAVAGSPGLRVFDTRTWKPWPHVYPEGARRAGWVGATPVGATWNAGLLAPVGKVFEATGPTAVVDLEAGPDARRSVALGQDHEIFLLTVGADGAPVSTLIGVAEGVTAVDLARDGVVGVAGERVVRLGLDGSLLGEFPLDGGVFDVALSPDDRLLALGYLDGHTAIRTLDGSPVARLHGHSSRVVSVAYAPDGEWLYTGSWDGTVRAWSTAELTRPIAETVGAVREVWGRGLAEALAGG